MYLSKVFLTVLFIKSNKQKKLFFVGILKVTDEKEQNPQQDSDLDSGPNLDPDP
jgi:hypothetical protein